MSNGRLGPGTPALRGRRSESALLDGVLAAVRQGDSRTLLLWGEPGVGKTALLEYLARAATDVTVLGASGVESEMELAFAGLQQLCAPTLDRLGALPSPQRHALEVAFGLSEGTAPDRFLVGLAVLTLLSEVADEHPVLGVIDDAQWLDRASAQTLAFVARRLLAEPVGLVFAARECPEELRGVPQFEVRELGEEDARALLMSEVRFPLDARVCDQIVAESRGNPLALIELPRGMSAAELAVGFGFLGAHTLSGRIEDSFARQLAALPEETRGLLLIAAADPVGDPILLWRAAESIGLAPATAGAAEASGLVAIDQRVTFRHPLVRSAVYRSAEERDRRNAHLALANATDRETDADRRAWHLAAAAEGPDEEVALELERSAARAQARGGLAAAAAFLQRAVALTQDPARRTDRALAAAQASLQAGAFDAALRSLTTAESRPLDEFQRARLDLLCGQLAAMQRRPRDAAPLLLKAARRLESFDLELARETYLNAWAAAVSVGSEAEDDILLEICHAARALPPSVAPRPVDMLLDGLTLLITEGRAAAAATLLRAGRTFAGGDMSVEDCLRWGWLATAASTNVWDDDTTTRAIAARTVQLVRDAGALAQLPIALAVLGTVTTWSGDFSDAASLIAEADSAAAATGSHVAPYIALRLLALEGRKAEAEALIASTMALAGEGDGIAATNADWAAAVLYNGLGRYEDAEAAARRATSGTFELFGSMWALPELVEAAAHRGDAELARGALKRLAESTQPCGTDFALGIEDRCRALLSEGESAEHLYQRAIERLGRTRLRTELARAHLLYGEWLRRENRRVDARAELRAAYQQFTSIGMEAFAERARKELLATGERVRKRTVETRDDLTAQERQIAELARARLSNPEIGARLFLSPRTVEWHLRKVFGKLGISSRKELQNALGPSESETILT
jgi:DNA-binding CsgD family transcriptional regulator